MELDNYSILKKNKVYISQEMKSSKSCQTFSTIFGFHVMICIYVPKVQEKSLPLSMLHYYFRVKKKLEIL